ncbi:MAG: FAD-dependent oxidoreductase [Desulfobacteraceae bacterium]
MLHVLIIGGGGTGGALAHDLTLRGFRVTLVEQGGLMSGTSGRHHGLLHSGARYALHDVAVARECYRENQILRWLTPQAIEPNDGLFVALGDEDMDHWDRFLRRCRAAGIPVREIGPARALALEPELTRGIKGAVQVPDATMDAWRLPLHFFATAQANGASILTFKRVERIVRRNGCVTGAEVEDLRSGRTRMLSADLVVNAAGPWAGKVAALAGIDVPVRPGPGVMVSVSGRRCNMVINRLHPAGEGDILVPQRNLTIIGTTIWLADDPDQVRHPAGHLEKLKALGARLMPELAGAPVHAVWSASRPLLNEADMGDPMRTSRGFACIDHQERDGLEGMISLIGGKATTLRAMAEEAADMVCRKSGHAAACTTTTTPLLPYRRMMQSAEDWI